MPPAPRSLRDTYVSNSTSGPGGASLRINAAPVDRPRRLTSKKSSARKLAAVPTRSSDQGQLRLRFFQDSL